ncbi:MAG: hypothetical protein JWO15_1595 [Sphingomonadales bacterium]|nr:hypothetical protein [Sphingomonadales bacterium]
MRNLHPVDKLQSFHFELPGPTLTLDAVLAVVIGHVRTKNNPSASHTLLLGFQNLMEVELGAGGNS